MNISIRVIRIIFNSAIEEIVFGFIPYRSFSLRFPFLCETVGVLESKRANIFAMIKKQTDDRNNDNCKLR